jgi:hypothetical protein
VLPPATATALVQQIQQSSSTLLVSLSTTQRQQTSSLPSALGPAIALSTLSAQSPVQSLGQLPVASFFAPLGYPGRIVFPGTGIDVRSATGYGPTSQLPGVFQSGGAGSPQSEPPRPTPPPPPPVLPLPAPRAPGTALLDGDTGDGTIPTVQPSVLDTQDVSSVL